MPVLEKTLKYFQNYIEDNLREGSLEIIDKLYQEDASFKEVVAEIEQADSEFRERICREGEEAEEFLKNYFAEYDKEELIEALSFHRAGGASQTPRNDLQVTSPPVHDLELAGAMRKASSSSSALERKVTTGKPLSYQEQVKRFLRAAESILNSPRLANDKKQQLLAHLENMLEREVGGNEGTEK